MASHDNDLFIGKWSGLIQYGVWNADFAEIVKRRRQRLSG